MFWVCAIHLFGFSKFPPSNDASLNVTWGRFFLCFSVCDLIKNRSIRGICRSSAENCNTQLRLRHHSCAYLFFAFGAIRFTIRMSKNDDDELLRFIFYSSIAYSVSLFGVCICAEGYFIHWYRHKDFSSCSKFSSAFSSFSSFFSLSY